MTRKYARHADLFTLLSHEDATMNPPYHDGLTGEQKRARKLDALAEKPFIVWDGEGARAEGHGRKPQNYILLGCYDGNTHSWMRGEPITTLDALRFIVDKGRENPDAWHVSFAFGYDVDMILRNLSPKSFTFLRDHGYAKVGERFRIEHIPGKWFRVTEYGSAYPVVKSDKTTVTIFDVWGFFQSSLVHALTTTIADHPLMARLPEIEAGKKNRRNFTMKHFDEILEYWKVENELFHALINRLRSMLYSVDLFITSWHGPGALASYAYRTNGIREHKADCGDDVYRAARYAYAGGRFERFRIGRFENAYGYDINSAYPNAISRLPSLGEGKWRHVQRPNQLVEFGVYRVRLLGPAISRAPAPLFHRDAAGNISYPWRLEGWYWSPEVGTMLRTLQDHDCVEILEGWEYTGWTTRPFAFVRDIYAQRREMKAALNGAQMALKLLLNSLYGKMAQRAGWERSGKAPTWHQLEWAGWVTSYTRAMLYELMSRIPAGKLIAVETDGIYTTATPAELGIEHSIELGGWEVTEYDELIYLQSGVYAKRQGESWSTKYRGLDRDSFGDTQHEAAQAIATHAKRLHAARRGSNGQFVEWPNIVGTTTRFVGYRNALFREAQNRGPMKVHHCVWETDTKEISCGSIGKRIHSPRICLACRNGHNAYEEAHETIIKSRAMIAPDDEGLRSHMHDIPWMDSDRAEWRAKAAEFDGLLVHD